MKAYSSQQIYTHCSYTYIWHCHQESQGHIKLKIIHCACLCHCRLRSKISVLASHACLVGWPSVYLNRTLGHFSCPFSKTTLKWPVASCYFKLCTGRQTAQHVLGHLSHHTPQHLCAREGKLGQSKHAVTPNRAAIKQVRLIATRRSSSAMPSKCWKIIQMIEYHLNKNANQWSVPLFHLS